MPHQAELESGFGVDLSGMRAQVGGETSEALLESGMAAATQGSDRENPLEPCDYSPRAPALSVVLERPVRRA